MLTRRHIRVKVLQSVYAYNQSEVKNLEKQEKFLLYNMEQMQDLYLLTLQLFIALRDQAENYLAISKKKHLATDLEKNPSKLFTENKVIELLASNESFNDIIKKRKLNYWVEDSEYVTILFNDLKEKDWYITFLTKKTASFAEDKDFLIRIFKEVIAPSEKFYGYIEDRRLTWLDDFPLVNTLILKMLQKISEKNCNAILIPEVYKNNEDRDYALELLQKVILNDEKLTEIIDNKTPNWDKDRIADIDMIILKMGISEFLYFPTIPVRVTINEYLEVAKEYSTPKSSIFINGILDKMVKDLTAEDKLNKIGRGLR
ncbi:MAG: transcription antitermination factor NusB [Flavobacteriaceae bacterium]|nr:transcription antitermination factor NusB [Flavobacteriaceae bacterium]